MQRIIRDFPVATVKRVSLRVSGARVRAAQHKRALPEIVAGGKKMRGIATPRMAFVVERSPCANAPVVRRGSGFPSAEKANRSVARSSRIRRAGSFHIRNPADYVSNPTISSML